MNIIAVDDERIQLEELEKAIKEVIPDAAVTTFRKPKEALEYAKELKAKDSSVDLAFLDVEMSGMNGLELAKALKDVNDRTNIVFVTGYSHYAVDAFSVTASDYIMKPVSKDGVLKAMERLRNPIIKNNKRLRVQCLGNFDVFADDKPLRFPRSKAKEIFAYLVSKNGARCSNNEIIAAIWENREDTESLKSQFRQIVADLNQALKAEGFHDVLIKEHGYLAVAPDKFSCDLYDFRKAGSSAGNNYSGKFMMQYSWAEFLL
ncbi:MAG: response regulator [Treponema sp.]|nr:response regulator [Treponema sp.]